MTLMLHAGAKPATYEDLRALNTPEGTATHVPIDANISPRLTPHRRRPMQ